MFLEIPTFYARMFFLHATGVTVVQKKHLAIGELYTVSLDLKYFQMVWNPFYNPPSCEANLQHPEMTGVGPILEGQQLKQHAFPRFFHDGQSALRPSILPEIALATFSLYLGRKCRALHQQHVALYSDGTYCPVG